MAYKLYGLQICMLMAFASGQVMSMTSSSSAELNIITTAITTREPPSSMTSSPASSQPTSVRSTTITSRRTTTVRPSTMSKMTETTSTTSPRTTLFDLTTAASTTKSPTSFTTNSTTRIPAITSPSTTTITSTASSITLSMTTTTTAIPSTTSSRITSRYPSITPPSTSVKSPMTSTPGSSITSPATTRKTIVTLANLFTMPRTSIKPASGKPITSTGIPITQPLIITTSNSIGLLSATDTPKSPAATEISTVLIASIVCGAIIIVTIIIVVAVVVSLKHTTNGNVYETTTVPSHVISENPAYEGERIYDDIVAVGGKKTVNVRAENATLNQYERLNFGVRGVRPVSMYPGDIAAPRDNNYHVALNPDDNEAATANDYVLPSEVTWHDNRAFSTPA